MTAGANYRAMTPIDLQLIRADAAAIETHRDALASDFYATLFELDPTSQSLFTADLVQQRQKFVDELEALVAMAIAIADGDNDGFETRATDLGRRHVDYETTVAHYPAVGEALLAALELHVQDWDDAHRTAWNKLYRLVSNAMIRGARTHP